MDQSALIRTEGKRSLPDGAVLFSLACFALLVVSRLLPPGGIPSVDLCAFHALTGLSCPSCGLTRAFCALSRGQFQEAWNFHPFVFPLYAATLGGMASPLLARRFPAINGPNAQGKIRALILILATALLLFGAWRTKAQWDHQRASVRVAKIESGVAPCFAGEIQVGPQRLHAAKGSQAVKPGIPDCPSTRTQMNSDNLYCALGSSA